MTETPLTEVEPEAIHGWFGLTYANYLVLPRTLLQSMPDGWQSRFVGLLREYDEAFDHVKQAEAYIVEAARECTYSDLTVAQMQALGVTHSDEDEDGNDVSDLYYDRDGTERQMWDRVLVPSLPDPVPHYSRGRGRIEPKLPVVG